MTEFKHANKPIIVANWKMNPATVAMAAELLDLYINKLNFADCDLIIAPPAIYVDCLQKRLINQNLSGKIYLGAQNICIEEAGAFTGEIAAKMFENLGCRYTIIGHSERRNYYQESDTIVFNKFITAVKSQLIPIVCVGENKEQFAQGKTTVKKILDKQLDQIFNYVMDNHNNFLGLLIAYEPIWAIGTGLGADPLYINDISTYIYAKIEKIGKIQLKANLFTKFTTKVKILYGGSVNKENYRSILQLAKINGILVGNASLHIDQFKLICQHKNNNCN